MQRYFHNRRVSCFNNLAHLLHYLILLLIWMWTWFMFLDACDVRNFKYSMSIVLMYFEGTIEGGHTYGQLAFTKFGMLGSVVFNIRVVIDSISYEIMVWPIKAWYFIVVRCVIELVDLNEASYLHWRCVWFGRLLKRTLR